MSLLSEERKSIILDELNRNNKVKVVSLAERLQVSSETIRRDMDVLEKLGLLTRVYGGAVKRGYQAGEPPYENRQDLNREAKQRIGQKAASLLQDGDTILMDTGTTVLELARSIRDRKRLTILTNSVPVASLLINAIHNHVFSGKVIMLGGELNPEQQSSGGALCESFLSAFHVDRAFISVGGVSLVTGISDYDLSESMVTRKMISVAKEVIVLADSSKIGVQAFCQIAPLEAVDLLISDAPHPSSWAAELEQKGIAWLEASDVE
ncbi:DeoR/GlpR family DNA-binding transcription regulator [Brevibacillus fluminis]|uniref:DeoR/GlpR family DNA-binding transcription regulator n=1 Tax=Brevibacillus fluminis TaxID=511487 RepID=UPI003F89F93A